MWSKIQTIRNWLKRYFWLPLVAAFAILFSIGLAGRRRKGDQQPIDEHLERKRTQDDTLRHRIETVDRRLELNRRQIEAVNNRSDQHTSQEMADAFNRLLK